MHASFSRMEDSTAQDWAVIGSEFKAFAQALPDRIMTHLQLLQGDYGGFPIDRYTHCLQTATLAQEDGRDDEYVVCALLHDIGDTLGAFNHADIAAVILEPFVSDENHGQAPRYFSGQFFLSPHRPGPQLARQLRNASLL